MILLGFHEHNLRLHVKLAEAYNGRASRQTSTNNQDFQDVRRCVQ